jgi:hypothetical protein
MIELGTRQDTNSYAALSGETRVFAIIGDPIAQVKSPFAVTQARPRSRPGQEFGWPRYHGAP